ncbi:MAG: SDR family NAD(P)-dependent oxidoreductase [Bacteroidetes bacterium]|nr:SDR family NAD(P)-dependent oxidoreductase [Bacteroidota bacterium]
MKTVLVTGANKGIGLEIARQMAGSGFDITISGRSEQRLREASDILERNGIEVHLLLMDVGNDASVEAAAKAWSAGGKKLDVLINNAAVAIKGDRSLTVSPFEIFDETIQINSYGPLRVTRAFLPMMNKPGRVIMMSSGGGSMTDPVEGWSPSYCVSKTMLNGLTRHLAYELEKSSIAVNAVCPGWVKTDMGGKGATRSVEKGAETPVWLATEASQLLSGQFFRDKKSIPW